MHACRSTLEDPTYAYLGLQITNMMGIYGTLLTDTYSKSVTSGLNDGAGIDGAGKIVSGAESLPNKGAIGMLKEFDSNDANGKRSAGNYAYDGFRPHQSNLLVLIASGNWQKNSAIATDAAARLEVGNTDLWYKLDKGYIGYYKGAPRGEFSTALNGDSWGFAYTRPVWEQVLRPYLQGQTVQAPAAPSGVTAAAASSSRINVTWTDNSSNESGFKVERSTDGTNWIQVATVAANVKTYASTGLNPSTTYHYRVTAYNAGGTSAASNTASATTSAAPVVGARPGEGNTGPTNPSALKIVNGLLEIKTDGAVVENVDVRGGIYITANNVTLRNFRVVADSYYGISVENGHSGILIEDGEITGAASAGLRGQGYTARRLNLHHFGADAIKGGDDTLIEGCWIHHLGMSDGAHADGVQIKGGVSDATYRGNFFDMPTGMAGFRHNSAFIIDTSDGPVSGILIENNWINGGGWTMHIVSSVSSCVVRNNLFGRDYEFGVKRVGTSTTWTNNRWWDTLELLP